MHAGLYGKLPAKRDFVAANTPRAFLDLWEPWLQGSVATSRQLLGEAWRDAYLSAPIWRFWLGANFCGEAVLGAFMPSIDGVGRYFPLTIFIGEGALPPPELEPNKDWFDAVETILLDALHPERDFESIAAAVAGLPAPAQSPVEASIAGITLLSKGSILVRDFGDELPLALRAARRFGHHHTFAGQSFWWTIGGEGFPPTAIIESGLPGPERFAEMLTGSFDRSIAVPA
ncbi:MAG TPA: type VI secretion system-associated protein TagF [Roseiarcus sp.]|nr:type VI secretion system-associated protein TagF [Roseiarcus sp.]